MGHHELHQAVLADLGGDRPRLACADWVESQGEAAMAEFVRLEIERSRLPYIPVTDHARDLERRAARLFRENRARWLGPLHKPGSKVITFSRSDRGLLDFGARGTAANILRRAEEVLDGLLLPYVLEVMATQVRRMLPEFLAWRHLHCVTHLRLEGDQLGPEEAKALAGCEGLCNVRSLQLSDNQIGDAGVAALVESPHLGRLESLTLFRDVCTGAALFSVLKSRRLPHLTDLHLVSDALHLDDAAPYRPVRGGPRLNVLWLTGKGLDDAAAAWVGESPGWAGLTALELTGGTIGPKGVAALALSPYLAGLNSLGLSGNPLGDAGARALMRSPHLTELDTLRLDKCGIGPKGAQALLDARHPPRWTYLYDNPIGVQARKRLLKHSPQRFSL
jgi:uncharacterized protein (TIGR02996 family)